LAGRRPGDPKWEHFPSFDEYVRIELDAIRSGTGTGFANSGPPCGGYIQASVYLPFIKAMRKFFDPKDILVVNASEFFADPISVVKRVYSFFGLPEYEPQTIPVKNAGPVAARIKNETRQLLHEFFTPLNRELYDFLGVDFGW
jgi:hypothetical protein